MSGDPDARETLPQLYQDRSFWAMTVTQFLGAFNDNVFKQLVLLLAAGGVGGAVAGKEPPDLQGLATVIFAAPFFLFSGLAGYYSERLSKSRVIFASKVGEIVVMALGLVVFSFYKQFGLTGAFFVLMLMGLQSTFFGPSKYGVLPEMLRHRDLPRANGLFLMTTFVAIILGTAVAGYLKGQNVDRLWYSSTICVAIAIVGTSTAFAIRYIPPAKPGLEFHKSMLGIPADMRSLILQDKTLLVAVLLSCVFWFLGSIVLQGVNSFGTRQLLIGPENTSLLTATMSAGIAVGCLLAGKLSHGRANLRLVRAGAWGMVACLVLLGMPSVGGLGDVAHNSLLGFYGSVPVLIALGVAAGVFAVPLQVVIQTNPPEGKKGRMIAALNVCTWFSIIMSGVVYLAYSALIATVGLRESTSFHAAILAILPVAIYFRPKRFE